MHQPPVPGSDATQSFVWVVMDGHGQFGHEVVAFCKDYLEINLFIHHLFNTVRSYVNLVYGCIHEWVWIYVCMYLNLGLECCSAGHFPSNGLYRSTLLFQSCDNTHAFRMRRWLRMAASTRTSAAPRPCWPHFVGRSCWWPTWATAGRYWPSDTTRRRAKW